MVGPGEVDDDLQPEVAEECSKYGEVVKCLVYEVGIDTCMHACRCTYMYMYATVIYN